MNALPGGPQACLQQSQELLTSLHRDSRHIFGKCLQQTFYGRSQPRWHLSFGGKIGCQLLGQCLQRIGGRALRYLACFRLGEHFHELQADLGNTFSRFLTNHAEEHASVFRKLERRFGTKQVALNPQIHLTSREHLRHLSPNRLAGIQAHELIRRPGEKEDGLPGCYADIIHG